MKATLHKSSGGDEVWFDEGGDVIAEGIEGVTGLVYVNKKMEPSAVGDLAEEDALTYITVLDHHVTGQSVPGRRHLTVEATAQIMVAVDLVVVEASA